MRFRPPGPVPRALAPALAASLAWAAPAAAGPPRAGLSGSLDALAEAAAKARAGLGEWVENSAQRAALRARARNPADLTPLEARTLLEEANPDAERLAAARNFGGAIALYESRRRGLAARPGYYDLLSDLYGELAWQRHAAGRRLGAALAHEKALKLRPRPWAVLIGNTGAFWYHAGNMDKAEAYYREALRRSPRDAGLLCNLGTTLHARGRRTQALELLRRAVKTGPASSHARWSLADALMRMGRTDEALPHLRALAGGATGRLDSVLPRLGTQDDRALASRAWLRLLAGDAAGAEALAREAAGAAAASHPGDALFLLGRALEARGRPLEALAAYERCAAASLSDTDARARAAALAERLGRRSPALDLAAAALRLDPGQETALGVRRRLSVGGAKR